jgi:hypothetical protein
VTADVVAQVEQALVEHFGARPLRASVSFVGVEPVDVLRFEPIPDERAYVSLGMSRHPMVGGDQLVRTAEGPRAELFLHLRDPADAFAGAWRRLAVLAAAPAVEGVVYRAGMTVDLGTPLAAGSRCTGVLTAASTIDPVPTGAGTVDVIRVVPATPEELAWCRVRGAAVLEERWRDADIDLLDLARRAVELG